MRMNFCSWRMCTGGLMLLAMLAGCSRWQPHGAQPMAGKIPLVQAFLVHGIVRELKPEENSLVIQHEEIPGYMPAMTMPLKVKKPKEMANLQPGDNVSFQMVVTKTDGWIEQV
jgi:Cu/Ag efflux protein CusF